MQAAGQPHHSGCAIGFALFATRLVLFRVPHFGNPSAFGVDGQVIHVSFWRGKHSISPVVCDQGYPITSDVIWSGCSPTHGSRAWNLTAALSVQANRAQR
jgi:hypothetical protein